MLRRQGIKTDQPPTAETDGAMEEDGAFFPPQVRHGGLYVQNIFAVASGKILFLVLTAFYGGHNN